MLVIHLFRRSKTVSVQIFILEEVLKKNTAIYKYIYTAGSIGYSTGVLSFSEDSISKITQFFLHISSALFIIMVSMERIFQLQ